MAASPSGTTSPVRWSIRPVVVAGLTIPIARRELEVVFQPTSPGQQAMSTWGWVDSGAPLSVIPHLFQARYVAWRPIPGVRVTWAGLPCDLGYIDIWLPTEQSPSPRGPFPILAKFPRRDPPGGPVPFLLGLEFFLSHQARLDLPPPPQQGTIHLP